MRDSPGGDAACGLGAVLMSKRGMKRHQRGVRPEIALKMRADFARAKADKAWRPKCDKLIPGGKRDARR
jgi:hypothetical protein